MKAILSRCSIFSKRIRNTSCNTEMSIPRTVIYVRYLIHVNTRRIQSSSRLIVWSSFISSFIVVPFFFEERDQWDGKLAQFISQRYFTLFVVKVVAAINQRSVLSVISLMQDGAPSYYGNPTTRFLLSTIGDDRLISRDWTIT